MSNHTPGPWTIGNIQSNCLYVESDQGKKWNNPTVCALYEDVTPEDSVTMGAWLKPFESAEANARLIAAAPELLESLDKAVSIMETEPGCNFYKAHIAKFKAAIAKAEGRE